MLEQVKEIVANGLGVAAAVLREEISVLSPQSGSFNKSVSEAEYFVQKQQCII